jgi:hypothetical protein
VKPVGTMMYVYSTVPFAGTSISFGISTTTSGLGMFHPSTHCTGAGLSWASPSMAPVSAHTVSVSISDWLRLRSLAQCPYFGSANHGGILRESTAAFIALAHGRAPS